MYTLKKFVVWIVVGMLLVGACVVPDSQSVSSTSTNSPTSITVEVAGATATISSPAELATPYAEVPTAGICAGPLSEDVANVAIWPDVPDPRCLKITPQQRLQVLNQTQETVQIQLGHFEATLQPGEAYLLDSPLGSYLAPGVHLMQAAPYSGPELWLEN